MDRLYSFGMTFMFGMGVNSWGGNYTRSEAVVASFWRATIGGLLGPTSRRFVNSLRDMRDEPPITYHTRYHNSPPGYRLKHAAAMILLPLAISTATIRLVPDEWDGIKTEVTEWYQERVESQNTISVNF